MKVSEISIEEIRNILKQVKDPEVPVLDIDELGVLRYVNCEDEKIIITITPTYSGCPALQVMESEIEKVLKENEIENFIIKTVFSPAWTTDWMSEVAKNKLREYGIAAPSQSTEEHLKSLLEGKPEHVTCPFCKSSETKLTSAFGSTACKALHYCNHCHQPFEEFKCH